MLPGIVEVHHQLTASWRKDTTMDKSFDLIKASDTQPPGWLTVIPVASTSAVSLHPKVLLQGLRHRAFFIVTKWAGCSISTPTLSANNGPIFVITGCGAKQPPRMA